MHLRLGQAARNHAQDQAARSRPRAWRLPPQPDRLQRRPNTQADRLMRPPPGADIVAPTAKHRPEPNNIVGSSADCQWPSALPIQETTWNGVNHWSKASMATTMN